jgi:hypothetical protein
MLFPIDARRLLVGLLVDAVVASRVSAVGAGGGGGGGGASFADRPG